MNSTTENIINTEVFFQENFSIDEYLSKCTQKSDLLTLRKELKSYGLELYTSMVDILKTETESIINLAEHLTNLNSKIDELSTPLAQLNEEIRTLYYTINDAKQTFKKHLDIMHSIVTEKSRLNLKMRIMASSSYINNIIATWTNQEDITVLERAVNEYSFQYLYLSELGFEKSIIDKDISNTATSLIQLVNGILLKALKENDGNALLCCLRMYVNLGKQTEAETFVKEKIVRPALSNIFTQRKLDEHSQNIEPLYQQALEFLNDKLKLLLTVLESNPDMKGFNFVINSFWTEADKLLRDNLPHITAPGNPEFFQRRFQSTWQFLAQIMHISKDQNLFENNPTFEAHMKRFNLPVYFEIRFQQIATKFEAEMLVDPIESSKLCIISENPSTSSLNLKNSASLLMSIERCFHKDVFLVHLADQIFKLTMLSLSRYIKWFESFLKKWNSKSITNIVDLEHFVICALLDYNILKNIISFSSANISDYDNTIFHIVPLKMRPILQDILKLNGQLLDDLYSKMQKQLVNVKVQQCGVYLQQVTSIPRLYRRTNRNIPKEPSYYVFEAMSPIVVFYSKYEPVMKDKMISIIDSIIIQLSEQYLGLVQEVLHSVCKTEESLRRLKSRNLNTVDNLATQTAGDSTSDETKIREQIKLDVGHFTNEVKKFTLINSKNAVDKLLEESGNIYSKQI